MSEILTKARARNIFYGGSGFFVVVFLGLVLVLAAFWFPLWSAMRVPYEFYWLHVWLPGWV